MKYCCPKCKSKDVHTVLCVPKGKLTQSEQKRVADGYYYWDDSPETLGKVGVIRCSKCGHQWTIFSYSAPHPDEITKCKISTEDVDGSEICKGLRTIELTKEGKITYKGSPCSETEQDVTVKGTVSAGDAVSTLQILEKYIAGNGDNTGSAEAVIYYTDSSQNVKSFPEGTDSYVWSAISELARKDSKIAQSLDTPFPDVEFDEEEDVIPELPDGYLYLTARGSDAKAELQEDGTVLVFAGSKFAETESPSCAKSVHDEREKLFKDGSVVNYVAQKDLILKSISRSCAVITGGLSDGNGQWKYSNGYSFGNYSVEDELSIIIAQKEHMLNDEQWEIYEAMMDLIDSYPSDFFVVNNVEQLNKQLDKNGASHIDEQIHSLMSDQIILRDYLQGMLDMLNDIE